MIILVMVIIITIAFIIIIIIITVIISMASFSFFNFSSRGIRVQRAAFYMICCCDRHDETSFPCGVIAIKHTHTYH